METKFQQSLSVTREGKTLLPFSTQEYKCMDIGETLG